MEAINEILRALIQFRDERDWAQFHNAKDLALAINIEASELLELYLWKSAEEADIQKVKEELADIIAYSFLLSEKYGFDIRTIVLEKLAMNKEKYPVEKFKGSSKKYDEI